MDYSNSIKAVAQAHVVSLSANETAALRWRYGKSTPAVTGRFSELAHRILSGDFMCKLTAHLRLHLLALRDLRLMRYRYISQATLLAISRPLGFPRS